MRWLACWLDEARTPSLEEALFVAGALMALGGPAHAEALLSLRGVAERATSSPPSRDVR